MLPAHRWIPQWVQVKELPPLREQESLHLLLQGRPPPGLWHRKPAQVSMQAWGRRYFQITLGAGALHLPQRSKFLWLQRRSPLGLWPRTARLRGRGGCFGQRQEQDHVIFCTHLSVTRPSEWLRATFSLQFSLQHCRFWTPQPSFLVKCTRKLFTFSSGK